jgi:predicted MPP superfamily phosphohydrolase
MISRRDLLKSLVVGAGIASLGGIVLERDLNAELYTGDITLERLDLKIAGLPPAFNGYKIGFISDIHISSWVPEEWFERAILELKHAEVQTLILGGDYILVHESSLWDKSHLVRNPRLSGIPKELATRLIYSTFAEYAARHTFPDGTLAVVGNHDHWNSYLLFLETMRAYPQIELLINTERTITRGEQCLRIYGVDDYLTGIPLNPSSDIELRDGITKRIIVSHNPDYISAIADNPEVNFSLALCGHTHGGQIVLPVLGALAPQVIDRRFIAGLCQLGERQVYTSRGLGVVGLPFRVNCPAEITVITLEMA